jgi:hypothetical protein
VQTKVLVNAQAANDVGNPPASNTTLGATNSVLGGGRLDNSVVGRAELHSNDAPPVDDASSGTSSDEDGDGRRPWQRRSHALTEPRDQVQNAPGVAVPTDRQDLHARTGVDVVPCAPIVEIGGAGQRGSFSADPWCPTSTGKRRRLAGVDHGKSCTDLVLPGNGGFDVPSNSFEDANRQGQKRSRADESMVSDAGGAMRSVVHAAANTEGFVSNANAKEPGSVARQGEVDRVKPAVHQRLGGPGGGRGMAGNAQAAAGADQQMSLPVAMWCATSAGKHRRLSDGRDDGEDDGDSGASGEPTVHKRLGDRGGGSEAVARNTFRNIKLKQRNIRKKRQRQAGLKSLSNETARFPNTELQSGAGDANEPGISLQRSGVPKSFSNICGPPAGAVHAVRPTSTAAKPQIGQNPKRAVQQSALAAAATQTRLLDMVTRHANSVQGRAGRAAIAQCDRESKRCRSLQTGGTHVVQATSVSHDAATSEEPHAMHQNAQDDGGGPDVGAV